MVTELRTSVNISMKYKREMTNAQEAAMAPDMADLYLKKIQSERNALWASARQKGLAKDTPERIRIADLDAQIAAHKAKVKAKVAVKKDGA
jgi:hypothetical protein